LSYLARTLRGMANEWRRARREAHKAALREVAEALGGDDEAYVIAGFLARHNRRTGGQVTTLERLRALAAPEEVTGIGAVRAQRIYAWQESQA
jgi:hypothetical protein